MQKKRPRGKGSMGSTASSGPVAPQVPPAPAIPSATSDGPANPVPPAFTEPSVEARAASTSGLLPGGRPVRVRRRLVAGVAAVTLTVAAAGAPAILLASGDLTESQRLVTLAELNRQAVTLAHSLADERDEVTAYVAAGREDQQGDKKDRREVSANLSARVDRQIDEIRGNVPAAHADLRRDLGAVNSVRRTALTGKGTALEAHKAYTAVVEGLHALADELAEKTPARAADATRAPAALGHAVEQASATRGLLLAALSVPGPASDGPSFDPITGLPVENEDYAESEAARTVLSSAAQQARVRELAALADFDQAASAAARGQLTGTVTGPDVKTAESYLARLTDQPELSEKDRESNREKVDSSLSARIEQMRGVESALASAQVERLEQLRDDDVTALELRIALLGGCLLVVVGISAAVARTLTRPLAVLRIGAARLAGAPEGEEPIRFTGRNDEFAQVVRSLNTLHGKLVDLAARGRHLDAEHGELAAAREEFAAQRAELRERTAEVTEQLDKLRRTVGHTFVNLSLRTLGLVERQLGVIESLEEREQDPDRLATLFKLDHMATVMRRHSENLLVLAGAEHGHSHPGPVPLVDVMRAAVSEIERYERVTIQSLPSHAHVAGFAADDLSHLVAELLENAASFSPPDAQVQLSGWLLESGEIMLSVQDEGIGMSPDRLKELNARLASTERADDLDPGEGGEGLGLRVAGLLARRHGARVQLREQKGGGIAAVVVLPQGLLPEGAATATRQTAPVPGAGPVVNLPGSVAEANSNALPGRRPAVGDPLIAAAEKAVQDAGAGDPEAASVVPRTTPVVPGPRQSPEAEAGAGLGTGATTSGNETGMGTRATAPGSEAAMGTGATTSGTGAFEPESGAPPVGGAAEAVPERSPFAPEAGAGAYASGASGADPLPGPEGFTAPSRAGAPAPDAHGAVPERSPFAPGPTDAPSGFRPEAGAADEDAYGHADEDAHTDESVASTPETTLQVRLPHPTPEPDAHERDETGAAPGRRHGGSAADGADAAAHETPDTGAGTETTAPADPAGTPEPVTDKGLPKRTPKVVAPLGGQKGRRRSVDAEELRRRLGGFHQGAKDGRRDAEAELADTTRTHGTEQKSQSEESGDTVEEAHS
ncbi:nitrate- and nitrite sensing domain-containing protein [Streptomyces sp. HNM0645]|uniref:sensor histidine kinase n=1 Tax=Streptomyces sp. HNM0645 TaxID=2782343 RepID=UPI0024B69A2A|nr:nitrate- and nitrite sensing domain-containing protein [Streptomyces sp. HNM0645]MDI9888393.1 nitrate- and nitrite sensing domain-containing protein [Streptomyces sp. HNM0645]